MLVNRRTGLALPDPNRPLLARDASVTPEDLVEAFRELILSSSGYRKVFAADGDENSATPEVRERDLVLAGTMALVYERYFRVRFPGTDRPTISVGTDTRDTGPSIADAIIRVLKAQGISVRYLHVAAAPEIMAYTGRSEGIDGFVYVTASHNPRGHNGVKFGFADGSVIGGEDADAMRELFRQTAHDYDTVDTVVSLIHGAGSVASVYGEIENEKQKAFEVYLRFIRRVVAGEDGRLLSAMRTAEGIGLVVDFNGSARTVSVDSEFLTDLGVEVRAVNDAPREIVHQIVPEGAGLETCRRVLEDSHEQDSKYTLGYVPDNDGDRGNLVYIDEQGHAAKLHAQETFALACVAELSWLVYSGELTFSADGRAEQKVAIVVNGPTSMRVDRIAAAFDAHVYRAEVGEANVVGLARNLRSRGFLVPILGEGSNGGNITHPSTVRDPLATVGAALKLLVAPKRAGRQSPFDIWLSRRDAGSAERFDRSLPGILRSLPRFATTSAFESRASLQIRTSDHGSLKSEYERIFKKQWAARKSELADRLGVRSFVVINYEGTGETHGMGSAYRSGSQRGGFKILFKDEIGRPTAFLWMRGSGTEPVFRIMADVEGEAPEKEEYLLDWHVEMIRQADRAAGT